MKFKNITIPCNGKLNTPAPPYSSCICFNVGLFNSFFSPWIMVFGMMGGLSLLSLFLGNATCIPFKKSSSLFKMFDPPANASAF